MLPIPMSFRRQETMVPDDYYQVKLQTNNMENSQRAGAKFAAEIGLGRGCGVTSTSSRLFFISR